MELKMSEVDGRYWPCCNFKMHLLAGWFRRHFSIERVFSRWETVLNLHLTFVSFWDILILVRRVLSASLLLLDRWVLFINYVSIDEIIVRGAIRLLNIFSEFHNWQDYFQSISTLLSGGNIIGHTESGWEDRSIIKL